MNAVLSVIRRDLLVVMRRKSEVLTVLFFFVIVSSLFPLGIGPESALLRKIAPGVLWVAALLATMLGLQRMFATDYADGTLEQMAISPSPLVLLVVGKIAAHWVVSGLPLVLITPLLGIQFDLDVEALGILMFALLLGVRGGGVLVSLLVLPLYIPTLIFGAGAVESHISGLGAGGHLSLLAAILVLAIFFAPWAAAAALRIALE